MTLNIRQIRRDDARLLFEWANDPVTRSASFNSDPIEWETHVEWLINSINSVKRILYLIMDDETPVGTVRFDKEDKIIVGVTVAPDQRGKGYGARIIEHACSRYSSENGFAEIYAYIKPDNLASIKAFEKAGFVYFDRGMCNNSKCKIFILESNDDE